MHRWVGLGVIADIGESRHGNRRRRLHELSKYAVRSVVPPAFPRRSIRATLLQYPQVQQFVGSCRHGLQKEIVMRNRISSSMITVAIAGAVSAAVALPGTPASAQTQAASGPSLKTPWGDPDLQGIWTDEFDTPLQRSAKYANQELYTAAQRAELDQLRGQHYSEDPHRS
jgi:hypothetical protein